MITFHWDDAGVMRCSFCHRPALECNVWVLEPCVERSMWDTVQTAASAAPPGVTDLRGY